MSCAWVRATAKVSEVDAESERESEVEWVGAYLAGGCGKDSLGDTGNVFSHDDDDDVVVVDGDRGSTVPAAMRERERQQQKNERAASPTLYNLSLSLHCACPEPEDPVALLCSPLLHADQCPPILHRSNPHDLEVSQCHARSAMPPTQRHSNKSTCDDDP